MDHAVRRATVGPTVGDESFDAYYFEHCCGRPYRRDEHWVNFFGGIADRIVARIQPQRVLDAGCALGLLVEALRDRGVAADGIDLSSYAIANVPEAVRPYCRHGSIVEEFPDRYNLIVTIEVLEHMPPRDGEAAIANICRHTDDVLFSSTPSDSREPSHVNLQPPEYWAEQFADHGLFRDVDFDASFVTPWAVRFRRSTEPLPRIVRNYERRYWALTTERDGTRGFSVDLQRELAGAQERCATSEGERDQAKAEREQARQLLESEHAGAAALRSALEETHDHLTRKVVALAAAEERAAALEAALAGREHELAHARGTIRNMEQSVFWRLRGIWARVSRLAGRPT